MSLPDGAHLEDEHQVGKGVVGGTLDGFPIFLLNLNEIPLNDDTLPLVLVSKGKREGELVEYMIEHHQRLKEYVPYLFLLHSEKLEEVLEMRELTLEEIGVDLDRVIRLMGGEEKILQHLGVDLDRVMRLLGGLEKVLQYADEEQAMTILVQRLGKEKARQIVEQIPEAPSADKAS